MRGVNYDAWLTEFLNYEDYDDMTEEEIEQLEKEKRDHFEERDLWELYDRLGRNL
jgi:molybdopterin synthase catalytic subunit